MLWTKTFIPTLKEAPSEAESTSHKLMLRAGLVRQLMAGIYLYLPLGLAVLDNIQGIIRQEMNAKGASELLLPTLQPLELWFESGRDKDMGETMIRFTDRRGRKICLGPTHEEVITDLVRQHVSSYRQLPLLLYQIQAKFRDEIRPRFGLIRACEFIMKDAYSFDKDEAGLDISYNLMYDAYQRIFKRCGLKTLVTEADPGVMGGSVSHEFMVPAAGGEDVVGVCPECKTSQTLKDEKERDCAKCGRKLEKKNCIEVGHIFKLGTRYSTSLGAKFLDAQGHLQDIVMGCYGIGVSRLISAIIEQNNDENGIIWPKEISPYQVIVLPLDVTDKRIMELAQDLYRELALNKIGTLFDDRDERAGVKFKDADLLGIPLQIILGQQSLKGNTIELKVRSTQEKLNPKRSEILKFIERFVNE